jgi:hypothetical protein
MTFSRRRTTALWLAVSAAVITAAQISPPEAEADPVSDTFLSALNNAGVGYNDPNNAVSLGQSICPMLQQPGATFAQTASSMAGNNCISADMSGLFTSIAISMYCPQMVSSFANGDWLNNNAGIPGLPFQIPGLPGLPT